MRIALMSAWNTDSGVAVHAEPLGKAWLNAGHELMVFSHVENDFHGDGFTREDEEFVMRCFGTQRTQHLDPRPILLADYDILVVQDLRMLPVQSLAKIFPLIKKKAWVVHILHENRLPEEPWFYEFDWDGVIYFDERQEFIKNVYPDAKYIPFPCHPWREAKKEDAKRFLGISPEKKVVLSFCQRGYEAYLRNLPSQLREEGILLFLVPKGYQMVEKEETPHWMRIVEEKPLSTERFDIYLFASDAVVLHKFQSRYHAVVSSTVFQTLGAGSPIFAPEKSDFFHPLQEEIIKYGDLEDLSQKLVSLFKEPERAHKVIDAAKGFVLMNSPQHIARMYIDFFIQIMKKSRR